MAFASSAKLFPTWIFTEGLVYRGSIGGCRVQWFRIRAFRVSGLLRFNAVNAYIGFRRLRV